MKNFESEFLKLNFDIGHFYCVSEDPVVLVNELADYIEHFHLAVIKGRVHNHLIPGLGDIHIKDILFAIKDSKYKGFVTIELYPYKNDPIGAATQSLQYVRNLVT
jgi:sugar phosphate isomerase/epimerase